MRWKLVREIVHVTLCLIAVVLYNELGSTTSSILTAALLFTYILNEALRVKGVKTPLTELYERMLTGAEVKGFSVPPLYLGVLTLLLMNMLPLDEASAALIITGLGDGFSGFLRALKGERLETLWRVKTSLAGFTLACLAGSMYTEPYSVPVACIVAAMVEALLLRLDDNLTVPTTAGVIIHLTKTTGFSRVLEDSVNMFDGFIYTATRQLQLNTLKGTLVTLDFLLPFIYLAFTLLVSKKRWKSFLIVIILLTVSTILIQYTKMFFRKPRPPAAVKTGYSFPSNHAALAGVFIGFFHNAPKHLSALVYILFIITIVEILVLGSHWASDIIVGFFIGLFLTLPFRDIW